MPQAYITAQIELTGRPPGLIVHSSELADGTNDYMVQINELIDQGRGKKRLTEEQRERKDLLQWRGAIGTRYADPDGKCLVMPSNNLFQAIVTAGREHNLGTKIEERGAVTMTETDFPVNDEYGNPYELAGLYEDERFRLRIPVNPNPSARKKSLLPVMRPVFPRWTAVTSALVLPELIDWGKFLQIIELAGNVGIGNGRKIGYGRFDVKVGKLQ